ncbi:YjjG family noncanonical pyrimidine nucleotidase [Draconibacterium sp. IB214405]|uniref:YjjG family noncanonical pyrimidine nucleotidase n=1 Tax=Draconibacterium sp. IB214405 TaxID=3097352 RepID=UPI002A154992|nr:YjjG family noncanonical pyrimidine nucleotidase [Draconibacterium sp. IB214405]MDX8340839.1 YjjG family noncanonical pyrimidine nucleotidase [Draconibacterium sp. IB214405]
MKKKYTHLFFDLDNTLWDFKTNSKYAMLATFNLLKLDKNSVDFEHFFETYNRFNDELWEAYRKKEVTKKELTRQRFQLTFDSLKITDIDALEMNEQYLSEMPKQTHLIEGAREILDFAKSRGYRMFIITNGFKEVQHRKLLNADLAGYFEKLFISEEIKTPKPGREIFEYAVKSANAKKKKSLMIGDDWDVDIQGARNFGMDAVYYNRLKGTIDNKHNSITVIESLNELTNIL